MAGSDRIRTDLDAEPDRSRRRERRPQGPARTPPGNARHASALRSHTRKACPMLCPRRAREATTTLPSAGPQLDGPTPRKTEALALMAEGPPNGQIAQRLVLSDGAVAKHVANIFLTLGPAAGRGGEEARRTAACGPCSPGGAPAPDRLLRSFVPYCTAGRSVVRDKGA